MVFFQHERVIKCFTECISHIANQEVGYKLNNYSQFATSANVMHYLGTIDHCMHLLTCIKMSSKDLPAKGYVVMPNIPLPLNASKKMLSVRQMYCQLKSTLIEQSPYNNKKSTLG